MIWQDVIFGLGQFAFGAAMFPSILGVEKPHLASCMMTAALLAIFSCTYASLGLWLGAVASAFCAACWLVLVLQQVHR